MATNLRFCFKEKQSKHVFESITVVLPLAKKPYTEVFCLVPVLAISPVPKPSIDVAGPSHVLTVRPSTRKYVHPKLGGPFTGPAQLNDDSVECVAYVTPRPQAPSTPNQEEMVELLKQVSYFIESEAHVNNIGDHFLATQQVSMDLGDDPSISFMAQLSFGTLESIVSHIIPMQDYTTIKTTEVVSHVPLQFMTHLSLIA